MEKLLAPINQFLSCPTPISWVSYAAAPEQLNDLLIDHCNCELKAAQTAIFLIRKYAVDKASAEKLMAWSKPYADYVYNKQRDTTAFLQKRSKKNELIGELTCQSSLTISQPLVDKMVRLVKEEFHHFEQVLQIMDQRGIEYSNRRAGRYAKTLLTQVRTYEPAALIDKLIIGALIEARSCERFAMLAPYLDSELERFYVSLLRSEARHYQDYLTLAQMLANENIQPRVSFLTDFEAQLINQVDDNFNFHSGIPSSTLIMKNNNVN